ncbi:jg17936 [Pararge aegeria aegeria]|uniref:Jg17936 protein n=1 Tax=Pararge aegeria aegeria TaxID=348720 RepID=A0A8S4RFZ1_9NEOP|nr:jg17936 [Pararge aegeria aegeria]
MLSHRLAASRILSREAAQCKRIPHLDNSFNLRTSDDISESETLGLADNADKHPRPTQRRFLTIMAYMC